MPVESADPVGRIHGLEEPARTAFDETAKDEIEIAVVGRSGRIVALQRHAERVEGIGGVDRRSRRETGVIARAGPIPNGSGAA